MIHFRPFWRLSIASAALFAILVGLGFWQLDRLQWKLALIADVQRNLQAPPISPREAIALGPAAEYRRVTLKGRFDNRKEAYIFGTVDGAAAYHVVVPFTTQDRATFLIDRGVVPRARLDPATRREGQLTGVHRVTGIWRIPDTPGLFTPAPDLHDRIWYAHDVPSIAEADGVRLAAPAIIEADSAPNPGGWPQGGHTVVSFRNEHLQYAITWFALAAGLFGVFLAFHISRGRLGFGPQN